MEQLLKDGCRFCKPPSSSTLKDLASAELEAVDLPHVSLIAHADDLYETVDGWYSGAGIFCWTAMCLSVLQQSMWQGAMRCFYAGAFAEAMLACYTAYLHATDNAWQSDRHAACRLP